VDTELWICRECAGVYQIPLDTRNHTRAGGRLHLINYLGTCALCKEVRQVYRAEENREDQHADKERVH